MADRQIVISVGNSRRSIQWSPVTMTVSELYKKLSAPQRGAETLDQYFKMPKKQQDALKDVGGFVGGTLNGSHRKANAVTGRDLITLDFDNIPGWYTDQMHTILDSFNCNYCIYSTRKHTLATPRLRVVIPLDRTVTADEYEPIARRLAEYIGIGMADPTTFDVSRLMYWPSCCVDSDFSFFSNEDAPFTSADGVLATYTDWHNFQEWPQVPNATSIPKMAAKQGDPEAKNGIVGAFCRTYDIYSAMEEFLPNIYETCDNDDSRFTYLGGTTTGGAVIYGEGKFLYSHHATDPCGGKLVNAFDLVRLHRFADMDADSNPDTPVIKLPSYKAMSEVALQDKKVLATLNREQRESAIKDFEGVVNTPEQPAEDDMAWADNLQRNQNGQIKSTIDNILIILKGDPWLKDKFALNLFANRGEVLGPLPWNSQGNRRLWSDTDNNGMYWYLEKAWGITGKGNIDSALDVHSSLHAFNEVQNYINSLAWDGQPRLDRLFIDYLGAEDTAYNKAVCRKAFTAAIARAMRPGCKFDNMLILAGPQGIGKSTILDKMSRGWFNDSIRTFEGKDASELLQGVWLVEVSELEAFRKSDVARIKQFLSLRADRYRAAYGRHVKELPRCCVFFGTTNSTDFLQDSTGNRRFWPVDVGKEKATRSVFTDLDEGTINQIWAEAKMFWQMGEPLYLTGEIEQEAKLKQEEHREASVREGLIKEFVERQIPADWANWDIPRRRTYWSGGVADNDKITKVDRDRICAIEVWCECFNCAPKDMTKADTREINSILANLEGWTRKSNGARFGPYSLQRGFERE